MKRARANLIIYIEISILLFFTIQLLGTSSFMHKSSNPAKRESIEILPNEYDENVIPDKYNTGYLKSSTLTKVNTPGTYGGLYYKYGAGNSLLCLDFYYNNQDTDNIIFIENMDFSQVKLAFYHFSFVSTPKLIIFANCNFKNVTAQREDTLVKCIFINCSFNSFYGSNASFYKCYFGGSYSDAIVPFRNIYVNDCYISDLSYRNINNTVHTDGTQIYGHNNLDAENIFFNNCRFETPSIPIEDSKSYVNACIMIQLEYSNGKNISYNNCIINGGGYSIYAWCKNTNFKLSSVNISNIKIGCTKKYGNIYHKVDNSVNLKNITETNSLYIGSVWKDELDNVHISVSNDTNQKRTLLIYTQNGFYTYEIPACPLQSEIIEKNLQFSDLPFDIDINTQQSSNFIVCFDATSRTYKQIRYINWTNTIVYIPLKEK